MFTTFNPKYDASKNGQLSFHVEGYDRVCIHVCARPYVPDNDSLWHAIATAAHPLGEDGKPLSQCDGASTTRDTVRKTNRIQCLGGTVSDVRTFSDLSGLCIVIVTEVDEYPYYNVIVPNDTKFNILNTIFLFKMPARGVFIAYEPPEQLWK